MPKTPVRVAYTAGGRSRRRLSPREAPVNVSMACVDQPANCKLKKAGPISGTRFCIWCGCRTRLVIQSLAPTGLHFVPARFCTNKCTNTILYHSGSMPTGFRSYHRMERPHCTAQPRRTKAIPRPRRSLLLSCAALKGLSNLHEPNSSVWMTSSIYQTHPLFSDDIKAVLDYIST
jgi:hypothetical protein